jgi:hypothetical protein
MPKVAIRKEDLDRLIQIAERTAKRTRERVVVVHDRIQIQGEDFEEQQNAVGPGRAGLDLL